MTAPGKPAVVRAIGPDRCGALPSIGTGASANRGRATRCETFVADHHAIDAGGAGRLHRTRPQPSVIRGSSRPGSSKTPRFQRTIEVIHDPRLFAARRFSSER